MISGQGKMEKTEHGALRESNAGRGRFDLLPYEAIEAYAIWLEMGAEKYPERNWEQGISVKDCINRMVRHALKAAAGMQDEDHLAAVMWNAGTAITMMKRKPECNDHAWKPTQPEPCNLYEAAAIECDSCPPGSCKLVGFGEIKFKEIHDE